MLINCIIDKYTTKFRRKSDLAKYTSEAIQEIVVKMLTDCFVTYSKEIESSMYLKYDLLTLGAFKEILIKSEAFNSVSKDRFNSFVVRAYMEFKKRYPKGLPLKAIENDLNSVIIKVIKELDITKYYII